MKTEQTIKMAIFILNLQRIFTFNPSRILKHKRILEKGKKTLYLDDDCI